MRRERLIYKSKGNWCILWTCPSRTQAQSVVEAPRHCRFVPRGRPRPFVFIHRLSSLRFARSIESLETVEAAEPFDPKVRKDFRIRRRFGDRLETRYRWLGCSQNEISCGAPAGSEFHRPNESENFFEAIFSSPIENGARRVAE